MCTKTQLEIGPSSTAYPALGSHGDRADDTSVPLRGSVFKIQVIESFVAATAAAAMATAAALDATTRVPCNF